MTYALIQDLLTDAAIAVLFVTATLPILHAFTRSTEKPATLTNEPEVEAVAPLHPPAPYLVELSPVEPAEWTEGDRAQLREYLEALPEQTAWEEMSVAQLRAKCDRLGIRWNRAIVGASGNLRHLNKGEAIAALESWQAA